jgi:hypothetical protein
MGDRDRLERLIGIAGMLRRDRTAASISSRTRMSSASNRRSSKYKQRARGAPSAIRLSPRFTEKSDRTSLGFLLHLGLPRPKRSTLRNQNLTSDSLTVTNSRLSILRTTISLTQFTKAYFHFDACLSPNNSKTTMTSVDPFPLSFSLPSFFFRPSPW